MNVPRRLDTTFRKGDFEMFDYNSEDIGRLCEAFLTLKDENECKSFLEDICTISEVLDMAQRLTAAKLLREGKSYQQISEQLGISTATISRVNRCLCYGAGGYRKVLQRLDNKEILAECGADVSEGATSLKEGDAAGSFDPDDGPSVEVEAADSLDVGAAGSLEGQAELPEEGGV